MHRILTLTICAVVITGMTAFARIDFGRQMIGRILLHKIKQALRPELWML